ncbi:MAG: hypothetical protein RL518_2733 [Pseudomonadota bacterium]|jgi:uncharacterized membrane protein YfcA
MTALLICLAALVASMLTLFSGFGLGTLLMPVVALFFPIEVAISITAIVHLANNIFKLGLVGRNASWLTVFQFGAPAVLAALVGALTLTWLGTMPALYETHLFGTLRPVAPVKAVAGVLIICFVLLELIPAFARLQFDARYLSVGGILSGFFGGLSGHQGALRSMFLVKAGLSKEGFIATGVVIAVLVDIARLLVYGWTSGLSGLSEPYLVVLACGSAFAGAFLGSKVIHKVTLRSIQILVSALLAVISFGLLTGFI